MSKFLKRSAQGAGVPHEKRTAGLETVAMPLPSKIVLSMNQHIGAPAAPVVAKGDQVYVGTVVGKAGDRKSTRQNSSHIRRSRMPSSA